MEGKGYRYMALQSYKELEVWKKSMDLVNEIYVITKSFPKSETSALASQMQRAAVSIPSNIAEGYQRNHRPEYRQFLGIANGSSAELETQLMIAKNQYKEFDYSLAVSLLIEVQKMLFVIIKNLG